VLIVLAIQFFSLELAFKYRYEEVLAQIGLECIGNSKII